jgi:nucleotide-binding universal stress UspA family protein
MPQNRTILLATDLSPAAEPAVALAIEMAQTLKAELLIRTVSFPSVRTMSSSYVSRRELIR